jgi:uncharacterized protein (UPF0332 family)
MSFDWLAYLRFAETALGKAAEFSDQDAVYRSVVSRAYYAVYCSTRNVVKAKDGQEFHGNDHQRLQIYLKEHSHKGRRRLGLRLQELHQLRIKADYLDNLQTQAFYLAQQALSRVQAIEADLKQIFPKHIRS